MELNSRHDHTNEVDTATQMDEEKVLAEHPDSVDHQGEADQSSRDGNYSSHPEDSLILHESMEKEHDYLDRLHIRTTDLSVEDDDPDSSAVVPRTASTRTSFSTPRFQFDDKTALEWSQLQESSIQRRRDFQDSVHSLSRRMANFTGQLGLETLEREKALQSALDHSCRQLEDSVDRITLKQDVLPVSTAEADRRATHLDGQITQSLYVTLYDRVRDKLGVLRDQVATSTRWQRAFAERSRQDAQLFRQLDTLAGSMARRYQEERASRLAAIELAGYQIQDQEFHPDDVQHFIDAIRELRAEVAWERQERIKRDAALKDAILRETNSLKRTLLHLAGDDPVFAKEDGGDAITSSVSDEQTAVARKAA